MTPRDAILSALHKALQPYVLPATGRAAHDLNLTELANAIVHAAERAGWDACESYERQAPLRAMVERAEDGARLIRHALEMRSDEEEPTPRPPSSPPGEEDDR